MGGWICDYGFLEYRGVLVYWMVFGGFVDSYCFEIFWIVVCWYLRFCFGRSVDCYLIMCWIFFYLWLEFDGLIGYWFG